MIIVFTHFRYRNVYTSLRVAPPLSLRGRALHAPPCVGLILSIPLGISGSKALGKDEVPLTRSTKCQLYRSRSSLRS
jgi:hypothetical protein